MMTKRYTVYFPAVTLAAVGTPATDGQLFGVYAQPYGFGEDPTDLIPTLNQEPENPSGRKEQDEDQKAIRKYWDRVTAPLRKAGFVKIGPGVAGKVRLLILKRPWLALYQRFWRPHAYIDHLRLHTATPVQTQAWVAADSVEGRSSELALALALLLAACRAPHRLVIATGQLGEETGSPKDPDVKVSSVGKIPEKLRLIRSLASANQLPLKPGPRDPVWLFTPPTFNDNEEPVRVETLPEVAQLQELGITVIPVLTLREAARRLQTERVRWMWQDSAWLGGIFCVPLILGSVMYGWLQPPLPATPTQLEINVLGQSEKVLKPLQNLSAVYLDDTLILRFSLYPGKFGYILQLQSDGDAYIESLPSGKDKDKDKSIPMNKFLPSMTNLTLLMLVTHESWSIDRQENIEKTLSALRLQPQLPPGVQYHFAMKKCTPMKSGPVMTSFTFKGPQVILEDSPSQAVCADWAKQLLETLNQETQGKIQLSGYTFKVAPY